MGFNVTLNTDCYLNNDFHRLFGFWQAIQDILVGAELVRLVDFWVGNLARILLAEGKLDEADSEARKSAELQPTGAGNHRWQVVVAVLRGDGETALHEARLEPNDGYRRFELALAHYVRGDRAAADAALADLIANGRDQLAYQIAEVYAVRGEKEKAFEWLQISFDNHDTGTLTLLIDPLLRSLRDDPRYKNLLAKLGLPATS